MARVNVCVPHLFLSDFTRVINLVGGPEATANVTRVIVVSGATAAGRVCVVGSSRSCWRGACASLPSLHPTLPLFAKRLDILRVGRGTRLVRHRPIVEFNPQLTKATTFRVPFVPFLRLHRRPLLTASVLLFLAVRVPTHLPK